MSRGTHGEKIIAAMESDKLPDIDKDRLKKAVEVYDKWINNLLIADGENLDELIYNLVYLLNDYKY